MREGIRKLLELERNLEVVGEASDGDEAIAMARAVRPDVLLLDVRMPKKTGLQVRKELERSAPRRAP